MADVQLKLQASLDLAFLRNQLSTIGTQLGGQQLTVGIQFDRKKIASEYRLLSRYIGDKTFRITLNSNLEAEIRAADRLVKALGRVQQAANSAKGGLPIGAAALSRTQKQGGFTAAEIKTLFGAAIQGGLLDERTLGKTRAQMVAALGGIGRDAMAGLLNGLNSGNADIKKAAERIGATLIATTKSVLGIASPSKAFYELGRNVGKGFELGVIGSMDKAFDALERQVQSRLKRLQAMLQPQASRRGAFPFIAKSGPIEAKALMAESAALAAQIDEAYRQLAQISARRTERLAFERGALAESAGRLLPPGQSVTPVVGAQESVTRAFYASMREAGRVFRQNFAANSYLPKASKELADAMGQAAGGLKALPGARGPIAALPSREMMMPLRFQRAMQTAVRIDMDNALRQQMQGRLLPAIGQTSYRSPEEQMRQRFRDAAIKAAEIDGRNFARSIIKNLRAEMARGLLPAAGETGGAATSRQILGGQRFAAPRLGGALDRGDIMTSAGPIADRLRTAAVQFSRNAPAVVKYLNLFSTAGGIDIASLPGPGESPGQYIRRIQQSLKQSLEQGGFGPGTIPKAGVREYFQPGRGPQLPGFPLQLALPPAGGTGGGDRVRGFGQPSSIVPFAPFTQLDASYYKNAFKYAEALKVAQASAKNFSAANTPLIGGLRGIASEFGEATKQVLLYGTAYKGLAFITSLPGQILNAAKSQQQYSNALKVATQETGTFAKEMLFVDNVQRAFGLNLETTRTGFVRLYASMAPAGFDSGSIEKLFTGISAATAALQLTPDRAERVIYAFGQMASKGQVMSEELKGQLGDVLPGALAIFASAAGKSVKDFNKEIEDGIYSGSKFRDLMAKVTDELINRFGTGAQAAGRSLQGLINTVRGDFTRTLEAFAPLANSAAQAVLVPLGNMLNRLSTSAKIVSGEMERIKTQIGKQEQVVLELKATNASQKDIDGARQSLEALKAEYDGLNEAFKDPAVQQQVKDLEALVEQLSKAGNFVKNFALGIGSVLSPILTALGGNFTTVIGTIASFAIGLATTRLALMGLTAALLAVKGVLTVIGFLRAAIQLGSLKTAMVQAGISSKALAAIFTFLGVQANAASVKVIGLRLALTALLVSTGIGALIALIGGLASAFATMGNRAQEAAEKAKQSIQSIQEARARGDVTTIEMQMAVAKEDIREIDEAVKLARKERGVTKTRLTRGGGAITEETVDTRNLSGETKQAFKNAGIDLPQTTMTRAEYNRAVQAAAAAAKTAPQRTLAEGAEALPSARRREERIGMNAPNMPPTEDATQGADEKAARDAERAAEHARRLADDKRKYEADLMKLNAAQAIALDDAAFDHWKSLQSLKHDFLEAGQNEWMAREMKFQRDLQAIEIRRIEAIRQARLETVKAESEAQASAYTAGDGGGVTGMTGLLQGSTGISSGPHFDVRRPDGSRITEAEARAIFHPSVRRQLQTTSGYGPRNTGIPGASTYHRGIDLAGPANTPLNLAPGYALQSAGMAGGLGYTANVRGPQGEMYQVGHLQQPQAGVPPSRQRAEAKQDYASALASQTAINAKEREQYIAKQANIRAQQEINLLVKEYVASIAPVEQQKLENSILQERIRLVSSGLYGEALETQQKIAETEMRRALGVKVSTQAIQDNQAAIDENNQAVKAGTKTQEQASAENASYAQGIATNTQKINELNQATKDYIPTLQEKLRLTQQEAQAELQAAIQRATPLGGMGLSAGFIGDAATKYEEAIGREASQEEARKFAELQNQLTLLEARNNAIKSSVLAIGDAFGTAMTSGVASLVDGTASAEQVFSDFLRSIGQALLQAAQQMIATYIAIGIAKIFAGLGGGAGKGGELNLEDMKKYSFEGPIGAGMFGGANGGIATGGWEPFPVTPFANGGIVNGPTLGLVGEGRYNEAIVPLPDGRSIPVMMKGGQPSSRELLSSNSSSIASSPVLNVSFESTVINGVEYVSRDQLEAAMMETRKLAARDGANRGAALAIDRLQHSPNTRRRIGMR